MRHASPQEEIYWFRFQAEGNGRISLFPVRDLKFREKCLAKRGVDATVTQNDPIVEATSP